MKNYTLLFATCLLALFLITGCSPALSVKLDANCAVSMTFESGTGAELSKTFTALTGKQMGTIQTGPAVSSLKAAGLTASGISQNGSQFSLSTGPDNADAILPKLPDAIRIEGSAAGKGSLSFNLSPETAQYIISLLPEETASYTELFMAPLFTGETMSADEYTDLVAAVYGQQLADELTSSRFTLNISVPGYVTSVSVPSALNATVTKNNTKAVISLPLSALLTLSQPHSILVFFDNSRYTN